MLFIVAVALLIFGPKRLPELGRTIGRGLQEFRKASNELKRTINTELALEDESMTSRRPFADDNRWPAAIPDPGAEPESDPIQEALSPIRAVADPRAEPRAPLSSPSFPSPPAEP
jgi:TatA/E family protein of Tat protein translocase